MNLSERISKLIKLKGVTAYEISLKTGISQSTLSRLLSNSTTKSNIKNTELLAKYFDVSKEWLQSGNGEMSKVETIHEDNINTVPLLPISAQGGILNDFIVQVKDSDCERIISPIKGVDFALTVSGESMSPEYPNGAQILIKRIDEKAFIDWGRDYVLDTCNGTVIKRIIPSENKLCIRCISINTDPIYAPFDVNLSDVNCMYRVLMCMSIK